LTESALLVREREDLWLFETSKGNYQYVNIHIIVIVYIVCMHCII